MNPNTKLSRDVNATAIPAGDSAVLAAGSNVYVMQSLGGNVTVRTDLVPVGNDLVSLRTCRQCDGRYLAADDFCSYLA